MVFARFFEVAIKIEVKENNVEQVSKSFEEKNLKGWFFFKVIKLKNNTKTLLEEKRILQENIKSKKLNKLKNRI